VSEQAHDKADTAAQQVTDQQLITLAQVYEADAVSTLYQRYADAIYRYVYYRVGEHAAVEDLVGDIFVKAIEDLPSYRDTGRPFEAWLYTIAHARVVDYYRRRRVRRTVVLSEQLLADAALEPDQIVAEQEEMRTAWNAVAQLTDEQQQVVALRFGSGYSIAEVANALRKTEGAVKSLQNRALASLRRLLEHGRER
jgi:RNA polymerase sigma-70 factor (ECF subfamily)